MRWGERLEYVAEAEPGDFIYVPPYVPHQEINDLTDEPLECVLVNSDQEPVVVNLDIEPGSAAGDRLLDRGGGHLHLSQLRSEQFLIAVDE